MDSTIVQRCIKNGQLDNLKKFVEQEFYVLTRADLYVAINTHNEKIFDYVASHVGKLATYDLHEAAEHGNLYAVKYMMLMGVKPDWDVLDSAIRERKTNVVQYLVETGEVKVTNNILWESIDKCDYETIKLIADKCNKILSHVMTSALQYNLAVVPLLVERGAKVPANAINLAITSYIYLLDKSESFDKYIPIIKFLIEHGAKITGEVIENALYYANEELAALLLSINPLAGKTILTNAISKREYIYARFLIDNGCFHDHIDLSDVILSGDLSMLKYLLAHGVKLDANTCVSYAVRSGQLPVLALVVNAGGKVTSQTLVDACNQDNIGMVRYLLKLGVEPTEELITEMMSKKNKNLTKLLFEYSEDY